MINNVVVVHCKKLGILKSWKTPTSQTPTLL